jgi:hypothetical protein
MAMASILTTSGPFNHTPINGNAVCDRCGCAELVQTGRDLDCANCNCPRLWLDQPRDTLPSASSWLGFIRLADDRWRCVAAADELPSLWDCLLTFPLNGDRLAWPVIRRTAA